jgi:purine nucleosidase
MPRGFMVVTDLEITITRCLVVRPKSFTLLTQSFETVEANPGLVLVTLGPLTNVALALAKKPAIAAKVGRCVVMGGAPCCEGNVTPAAEYNIWVDPEAARIVMLSGFPVELIGWQLSRAEAVINETDIELIQGFGS